MIDEGMKKAIEKLAMEELERSNKRHSLFNSTHEGYAVIKEEVEEAEEELNDMQGKLLTIWCNVRNDNAYGTMDGHVEILRKFALNLAAEAIQVAAMCSKFIESTKY